MKNTLFICLFALFAFSGCVDDEEDFATGGNISPELTPENKENAELNAAVFEQLNLDYPGLEKVKQYYEAGENYLAASALLEYYRMRSNVENPNLSLIDVITTTAEKEKADYALEYCFASSNFVDKNGKPFSIKKDGVLDWTIVPSGVTSGEYQKQLHRHQWFIPQGKAYRETGDEKYVASWIEVYGDWIVQNPKPEAGPIDEGPWWQLQVAHRVSDQVQLLEYFKPASNFTPEWLTTFLTSFAEQADFLHDYPYTKSGNILITQANALTDAGILMPEFKRAQNWLDKGYEIYNAEIDNQFFSDGWHKEMSLQYHTDVMDSYYNMIAFYQTNNLASKISPDFIAKLRKPAEVLMHLTYPNYFRKAKNDSQDEKHPLPSFNDSWKEGKTRNVLLNNFKKYLTLFPDSEELRYMTTAVNGGSAQGVVPGNDMKLFDEAGYYIFRNGWQPESTVMIFSNNRSNDISPAMQVSSHNQPDNGTFELYINGRNFFPDSGVAAYSGDDIRTWFRDSDKHNTLTLKDMSRPEKEWKQNIEKAAGKLLTSQKSDNFEMISFENPSYSNLTHRRTVFFVKKQFFVLVDEAIGNASNPLYLSFNLCEGTDTEVVIDHGEVDSNNPASYSNGQNGAHTAFADGNNILVRTFADNNQTISMHSFNTPGAGEGDFTGRVSYVKDGGDYKNRPAYTIYSEKEADKNIRFITVILPVSGATTTKKVGAQFTDSGYSDNGGKLSVTIDDNETYNLEYIL